MNKSIAEQLIKQVTKQVTNGVEGIGGPYYADEINPEKLIELVVKQCVIICQETGDLARKGCQVTEADVCGYRIEQHFGIDNGQ